MLCIYTQLFEFLLLPLNMSSQHYCDTWATSLAAGSIYWGLWVDLGLMWITI